jgi:PAS domain-containing protein
MAEQDRQPEDQPERAEEVARSSPDVTPPSDAEPENDGSATGIRQRWWRGAVSEPLLVDISTAHELMDSIIDTVREPLLVLDGDLRVIRTNLAFYQTFQVSPEETLGELLYDLGNGQWNIPALRTLLEEIIPQQQVVEGVEVRHTFPTLGERIMVLNARLVLQRPTLTPLILLAIEDRTERIRLDDERTHVQAQQAATMDSIAGGLIIYDAEGRIVRMNAIAETVLGVTTEREQEVFTGRVANLRVEYANGTPVPIDALPSVRALRGETVQGEVLALNVHTDAAM